MKFYIVDAFTDKIFGGNPAGVVIVEDGDYPSFDIMQKTAAELGFSETAFVKRLDEDSFQFRYITPTDEVDLCGHATIASFSVISKLYNEDAGLINDNLTSVKAPSTESNHVSQEENKKTYTALTKAGNIKVSVDSGLVMMDMAKPEIIKEISDPKEWNHIRTILGLSEIKNIENRFKEKRDFGILCPAVVSTGLPDILFPVNSLEELNAIEPDFETMSKLSEDENVVGVHAFAFEKNSNDMEIHCRNFAPLYGIPEEAATGTANGALTYYLNHKGIIEINNLNIINQGAAMNRPSKIVSIAERNVGSEIEIKVGGTAAILSEGEIYI